MLILTIHNEVDYLIKAVEIGCDGYVLKDSDSNLLRKAIYTVYKGENFIQPSLTPVLNAGLASKVEVDEKLNELTRREIEVLKLIAEGLFNKEIASKLDISELSFILDSDFNISNRSGLHCAPLAHKTLGTYPNGTVRLSLGYFNTLEEIDYTLYT